MKLATKIALGYALVILSLSGILFYQAWVISQMQEGNRRLSEVSFEAVRLAISVRRSLDPVEEFTRKYSVTQDQGYLLQVESWHETFSEDLQRITEFDLDPQIRESVASVQERWAEYRREAARLPELSRSSEWMEAQLIRLDDLGARLEKLIVSLQDKIRLQVREASQVGGRTEQIALVVGLGTLGMSLLLSFLIVRSVSARLSGVVRGTRAVARGDFSFRLPDVSGDEFSGLVEDFNSMTRRLSQLEELKKDFVSHASHELKSPLASIQETTRLLLEEVSGSLTAAQRRLLDLTLQSSQRLASTIDNLLDLSRIEAGVMEYHLAPCELRPLVEGALAEVGPQSREKDLHLDLESAEGPLPVQCDRESIHRLLVNLLVNALKFSPPGGRVRLRLARQSGVPGTMPPDCRADLVLWPARFVLISVEDRGPGVPDREKERIFQRFGQGGLGQTPPAKGVGLGLTIARDIVKGHRGAIWVEDRPGGGSVFQVLLPLGAGPVS